MIDQEKKILFIHIPKAGGSSIESMLLGSDDVGSHRDLDSVVLSSPKLKPFFPLGRHGTLRQYEAYCDQNGIDLKDFRIFSIIRNPTDLLRSFYKFRLKHFQMARHLKTFLQRVRFHLAHLTFPVFLACQLIKEAFYRLLGKASDGSLSRFVQSESGLKVQIFRLEDISRDISDLSSFLSLPPGIHLRKMNATVGSNTLNSILLKLAARSCYEEISEFYHLSATNLKHDAVHGVPARKS